MKLILFDLTRVQTLQTIYLEYLGRILEAWQKNFLTNKVLKELKFFNVSGFLFWAIEEIKKKGNDGKFSYFHGSKLILQLQSFQKLYLDRYKEDAKQ